jgi:hypothetical protein
LFDGRRVTFGVAKEVWQAMYDAAIAEGKPSE